ncbi:PAS domain-containing protein [Rapidithrix thailandica]|uniref:PAS domain-containing protein n=1 Tax=Rapidithrix thailandica TaxID=413964 RepID=A0AAW9SB05_9BACT
MSTNSSQSSPENTSKKVNTPVLEAQYKALNELFACIEFDELGNILLANARFCELFGYSEEELLAKSHKLLLTSEYSESMELQLFWDALKTGDPQSGEFRRITKDKKEINLSGSYFPVFDKQNKLLKIVLFGHSTNANDTGVSGQVSDVLNESHVLLELDLSGNIISANTNFCQVIGQDDVTDKTFSDFLEPKLANSSEFRFMWEGLKKGEEASVELELVGSGAKSVWLDCTFHLIEETQKIVAVAWDISHKQELLEELGYFKSAYERMENELGQNDEMKQELAARVELLNKTALVSESDLYGTITYVNEKFCEISKYTEDECLGKPHSILRHPETPKAVFKEMWETIQAGKIFQGRYKNKAKDGSYYWVDASIAPVLDEEGKPIKYLGIRFDITEQMNKQEEVEKLLEQSTEQQESIAAQEEELRQHMGEMKNAQEEMAKRQMELDGTLAAINSNSAFIEFDKNGDVTGANNLFLKAFKYKLEEIIGKHHRIFCDDAFTQSAKYKLFWEKLREGTPQTGEFKRLDKHGNEVWLMANYTPVVDENGDVVKIIKLATDITVDKLRNLDTSGQLDAVNKASCVIEYDLEGNVLQVNDNFLSLLGYTLEEIKGKHHRTLCEPEYVASSEYQAFWKKLKRGEFDQGTYKQVGKNEKDVYLQATYNPIFDMDGKPVKVVMIATDITRFTIALSQVSNFVNELSQGNFDAELSVHAEGDLGRMIQGNLALRDNLKNIINEIYKVIKSAGEDGNLNARLALEDAKGMWKELIDALNLLLQSIADPILEMNAIISELADGNLTQRFAMKANGDILNMAQALNTAMDNLNELLSAIGEHSDVIADSSVSLLEKSESMKNNTTEVASAISQMAQGAQDQAQRTDESSKLVENVMESAGSVADKAESINIAAETGQKSCKTGLGSIQKLVESMSGIGDSASKTSSSIGILTRRAEEIGRTLNVITDIAAQTNLLALNAAIEAARAGDAGRGFAVVAEEIRKLAEDSRKSAIEIEKIIGDVQKDTQSASKAIDIMETTVDQGKKATQDAEEVFKDIAKSSEETFTYSKAIKDASVGQKAAIESVVKNIEQIVVVAEETAAGTQQVANSSQELNASMELVASSSNQLSEVAKALKEGINKFTLAASK